MSVDKIKRLKQSAQIEFVERKSVFMGFSTSVENEEEALEIIKQHKKKYSDATHNVYAYILGDGIISRYSDDGEPQGTAGMPVLNSIRMSGIQNVCVIVTRYFGGILLGAGGLVRAYSTAASMALDAGGVAVYENYMEIDCNCSYSDYQKIQPILESYNTMIDNTEFSSDVNIKLAVKEELFDSLKDKIIETFANRIVLNVIGNRFDCM